MTIKNSTPDPDTELLTIGWREWVGLPDLGITAIKAKVDTGARTSTLHAFSVEPFQHNDGREWVRFGMHPEQKNDDTVLYCEAPIHDRRLVRDSGGHEEERIIIETRAKVGEQIFTIELTLTSRDNMLFRMLLGRTAMRNIFAVNPARSFLMGRRKKSRAKATDSQ
jgi:hypothetical protein